MNLSPCKRLDSALVGMMPGQNENYLECPLSRDACGKCVRAEKLGHDFSRVDM